ncbi:hypothetical protein [Tateyamaria pelophila]|uniref:hypothetical protein n=1 Tax=Tateyamaria pelophila TaxID=328415 RepID=UPI001CC14025|nr:hypothetical protein [Tateyamaria pelophila]
MSLSDGAVRISDWRYALKDLKGFIVTVFTWSEHRPCIAVFMGGLLSGMKRKTGLMRAEEAEPIRPYRIQSFAGQPFRLADAFCEWVRNHAIEALGSRHIVT